MYISGVHAPVCPISANFMENGSQSVLIDTGFKKKIAPENFKYSCKIFA